MNQPNDRDEWCMAQLAAGQFHYLEPLLRRHASPLLTFIQRMIGDRHRSEELFQEVFLAVWLKRRQYQFPRPFKSWLYGIALNKCRATYRQRSPALVQGRDDDVLLEVAGAEPSPAETAIATETAALVSTAVTRLPARQRAVVVFRVWQGLSYEEIADLLECTEATVRSNMHHGLAALRKQLEPHLRSQ